VESTFTTSTSEAGYGKETDIQERSHSTDHIQYSTSSFSNHFDIAAMYAIKPTRMYKNVYILQGKCLSAVEHDIFGK
jgi:hypothetical protein